ncbi:MULTISPECIES: trehalose-phosphatase [Nocardiopsis]|uniref:Trehalose 6-phosphate phosphatase n=1 Tax=Nocardiopsis sinuspersici TaxID=501010 RepID=A0A1V3C4J9_9ACTN|nr:MULTISPECIES: trehalose-phosphatase [Nocardiopsis]NYH52182.1 trehalose 6-phosphate phosphatase [Nocardiopsis sinuspersici]OOC55714.1 trehalose-phosphatase [Nocardiopsis sinuspersici]
MSLPRPGTDAGRTALDALLNAPASALAAFDFDGTLAPIVDDPRTSAPYPGIVEGLADLAGLIGSVAVVTGRPAGTAVRLGELDRVPGITVLGHYGAERWVGGRVVAAPAPPGVELVREELPGLLDGLNAPEGTWIEDKGRSLAVHTRRTADPDGALTLLTPALSELARRAELQVEPGRMVVELRPQGVDKGAALTALVAESGPRTVLYAGDDLGDLPAFAAVAALRDQGVAGLTVCSSSDEVAAVAEAADLVVPGPAGLADLLRGLTDAVRGASGV